MSSSDHRSAEFSHPAQGSGKIPPLPEPGEWNEAWYKYVVPTGIFLVVLGGGLWLERTLKPDVVETTEPAPQKVASPLPRKATLITPATFERLERLKEASLLSDQLQKQVAEAQAFYQEYPLDQFLQVAPESLSNEQLAVVEHFCDKGLFTVEREIELKLLHNRAVRDEAALFSLPPASQTTPLQQRLDSSLAKKEGHLKDLSDALALYRRERGSEVIIPEFTDNSAEEAWKMTIFQKLEVQRSRVAALEAQLQRFNTSTGPK